MIRAIQHATFLSDDLARSRAFYEGVLGLQADPSRPAMAFDGVWYRLHSGQQIHLMSLPNPPTDSQRPVHGGRDRHLALAVGDLAALMARLAGAGIPYTLSRSGRRALFCRDPDGNALEFIETAGI